MNKVDWVKQITSKERRAPDGGKVYTKDHFEAAAWSFIAPLIFSIIKLLDLTILENQSPSVRPHNSPIYVAPPFYKEKSQKLNPRIRVI